MSTIECRNKAVWGARLGLGVAVLVTLLASGCSDAVRSGQTPAMLLMTSLTAAKGGGSNAGSQGTSLSSDVLTLVPALTGTPTVFADSGQATFQLQMRDPLLSPTALNAITLTQYHVKFIRADGHNVQGVDVPFEFDGALNFTVTGSGSVGFTIVRLQSKTEAPLAALVNNFQVISTIAEVTFYGQDRNGRPASVSGRINIDFSNWGD